MSKAAIWFGVTVLLGSTCGAAAQPSADAYPNQTVRIVVPFSAGSISDGLARVLADELAKAWKQSVIVENRPGIAGTASVAKSCTGRLHADAHLERAHHRLGGQQEPAVRSGEGFRRRRSCRIGAAGFDHAAGPVRPRTLTEWSGLGALQTR